MANSKLEGKTRRKMRIRKKVSGDATRPRLTIYRSAKHIYAQLVDDVAGATLLSASTVCKDLDGQLEGTKVDAATKVGVLIAERCKSKGIAKIVFDRNGYLYHGRIKALAEAARKGGLDF